MRVHLRRVAVATVIAFAGTMPALAQSDFDSPASGLDGGLVRTQNNPPSDGGPSEILLTEQMVLTACTAENATEVTCQQIVAAYFEQLAEQGVDAETVIATLVEDLAEAGGSASVIAAGIETVATYAPVALQEQIRETAATVRTRTSTPTSSIPVNSSPV